MREALADKEHREGPARWRTEREAKLARTIRNLTLQERRILEG